MKHHTDQTTKTIGLLGGTFDPVHNGHLHIALQAYKQLGLAGVRFIPCHQPVHKSPPIANAEDRLAMLTSALAAYPMLSIEPCEIQTHTPCYTIDTLSHLYHLAPTQPLCFLAGMDAFMGLTRWHRWQALTDYAHWVVLSRPSYQAKLSDFDPPLQDWLATRLTQDKMALRGLVKPNKKGVVLFQSITPCPISATTIRAHLLSNKDCQADLPSSVWQYILARRLYQCV